MLPITIPVCSASSAADHLPSAFCGTTQNPGAKTCPMCKKQYSPTKYLSKNGMTLSTCNTCRAQKRAAYDKKRKGEIQVHPDQASDNPNKSRKLTPIDVNDYRKYASLEDCGLDILQRIKEAKESGNGYIVSGAFSTGAEIEEVDVRQRCVGTVQQLMQYDGHKYCAGKALPTKFAGGRAIGRFKCTQDTAYLHRIPVDQQKRQRQSHLPPSFACNGAIVLTLYPTGDVEFCLRHNFPHPTTAPKDMSAAVLNYIGEHSSLTSREVFRQLKLRQSQWPGMAYITRKQVHEHWAEVRRKDRGQAADTVSDQMADGNSQDPAQGASDGTAARLWLIHEKLAEQIRMAVDSGPDQCAVLESALTPFTNYCDDLSKRTTQSSRKNCSQSGIKRRNRR